MRMIETLQAKQRGLGKQRPFREVTTGKRIGRDGRIVNRDMVVDRRDDCYLEHVETEDGQLIVHKDEKLSQHQSSSSPSQRPQT